MDEYDSNDSGNAVAQSLSFHGRSETFRAEIDWQTYRPSRVIVAVVAKIKNKDITDLPPLFKTVDVEALNAALLKPTEQTDSHDTIITLDYADCQVTIHGHGTLVVNPPEEYQKQ